jgi:ribose-phosphate pyrophosphokinase
MPDINLDDVEQIKFPDGQTHIDLGYRLKPDYPIDIRCKIRSPDELFKLLMLGNILDANDVESRLHIKYLMGARMDRPIDQGQPFTLKLVCDMINNGFPNSPVTVFCPHSEAVSLLLKNYKEFLDSEKNFYYRVFEKVIPESSLVEHYDARSDTTYNTGGLSLIIPDAGAGKRWYNSFAGHFGSMLKKYEVSLVECSKKRDMNTGKLSGFKVPEKVNETCLILDDLCDGGRTFIGLAEKLHENGAKRVELAVCHGIFSYGYDLEGIDQIYTTNSFAEHKADNVWSYKV